MSLPEKIASAEKSYLGKLCSFFKGHFRDTPLWSHGIEHHLRVWQYSKQLLTNSEISSELTDREFPLKALIASLLHDLGMVIDPGPRHGRLSRDLCEKFLIANGLPVNNFIDLLDAVEKHDEKTYGSAAETSLLLDMLSVADDLDALGYTGIYRYIEIYLARKIPYEELGLKILENVSARYKNLSARLSNSKPLSVNYTERFRVISDFCTVYTESRKSYIFGKEKPFGYCGVAEVIGLVPAGIKSFREIFSLPDVLNDKEILDYFNNLNEELRDDS
jgi:HD superfamily phosphodiesterase